MQKNVLNPQVPLPLIVHVSRTCPRGGSARATPCYYYLSEREVYYEISGRVYSSVDEVLKERAALIYHPSPITTLPPG